MPVGSSMPQGDPASRLGLIVVLSQAVQSVENEAGVKQSVFLDDRILLGSSASWFSALEAVESSLGLCGE